MKHSVIRVRSVALATLSGLLVALGNTTNAESVKSLPAVIQSGLTAYAKEGPEAALNAWLKAGPMEGEKSAIAESEKFKQIERYMGKYKAWELIDMKEISASSKMVYLAMNYDRGAAFASFLVYKGEKDWVVTNMDFNTKPEAVMPWVAFSSGK